LFIIERERFLGRLPTEQALSAKAASAIVSRFIVTGACKNLAQLYTPERWYLMNNSHNRPEVVIIAAKFSVLLLLMAQSVDESLALLV
jgi:hypothetical protein